MLRSGWCFDDQSLDHVCSSTLRLSHASNDLCKRDLPLTSSLTNGIEGAHTNNQNYHRHHQRPLMRICHPSHH